MILDFKTRLFCAATGLRRNEVDVSEPVWRERITSFFDDSNGMPAAGDPSEYSAAFEAVFPDPADRRRYIDEAVRKGVPSFGHHILASLVTAGATRTVFTTNFDSLIERSTTLSDELVAPDLRAHLTVGALDSVDRACRAFGEQSGPILVKLHGDYQSVELKNTDAELQDQDERLRGVLVDAAAQSGLVVVGYSGRDDSVMDALEAVLSRPGCMPNGLWWIKRPGENVLARVESLLDQAEQVGVDASLVESENFDELMGDVEEEVPLGDQIREHFAAKRPAPIVRPVELPTVERARFPVVRCSALEILDMPEVATAISVKTSLTTREARKLVRDARVWGTVESRGPTLVGFGADADLSKAFSCVGGAVSGEYVLDPIEDMADRGLLYDALARAIARRLPLRTVLRRHGHVLVVAPPEGDRTDRRAVQDRDKLGLLEKAYGGPLVGKVPGVGGFAEAIEIRIENWDGRWWCVFKPHTWVDLPSRPGADEKEARGTAEFEKLKGLAADWRRERWAQRYNPWWNRVIAAWAGLIAPNKDAALSAHHFDGAGIPGQFRISPTTAWTRPVRQHERPDTR